MQLRDHRGLPISTEHASSVESYEEALTLFHGYYGDPLAVIDRALEADPAFLMGHAFRAGLFIAAGEKRALPELRRSLERAEALIGRGIGTDRERAHVAAARSWCDGNISQAVDRYNRLTAEYPRDAFALQVAHLGNFFLGRSTWLRDHTAWALPHYGKSDASYGYVLGMAAFGLEECNDLARAEATGYRALDHNPRDPWAIHAIAHSYEMQGKAGAGIRLYESREAQWSIDNSFAVHNWWHLALFHLELGDFERVLDLYDGRIRGGRSEAMLDLVDASSLLWRLNLHSIDLGSRFAELADTFRRVADEGYYAFNDVHALMAYSGAKSSRDIERVLSGLRGAAGRYGTNAELAHEIGLPVGEALTAFARGDYRTSIAGLFNARVTAHRFGGSNAQRDVLDVTLIEAALRAGERRLAEALLEARRARKPESPETLRSLVRALDESRPEDPVEFLRRAAELAEAHRSEAIPESAHAAE
jgi:tetratricopeptide (TPR) repeat protein